MGQIARVLTKREKGVLPSQTKVNPKNQEQVKAITHRRRKEVETKPKSSATKDVETTKVAPTQEKLKPVKAYVPTIPFP